MRIWSLHPSHLDRQGLTALWRETLLAQAVLAGRTKGYKSHPQLQRFSARPQPLSAVAAYLDDVRDEATRRGYNYDPGRIDEVTRDRGQLTVTTGQVDLEWAHLGAKLAQRSPLDHARWLDAQPTLHPSFVLVEGPVEDWERATPSL